MQDDNLLVSRFKNKDLKAFDEIFDKYHRTIYYFAFKMIHSKEAAEDITQDTFVKVYKNLSRADESLKLSSWIFKIAYNTFVDYTRKNKTNLTLLDNIDYNMELPNPKGEDNPEESFSNKELAAKIHKTMERLSKRYKTVIILRDYNNLSYRDAADILGLSETAVKSLIHRARLEFQKKFKELE